MMKRLQGQVRRMLETAAKMIKIVLPRDNVMVPVPDLGTAKIVAHSLRHPQGVLAMANSSWGQGTF